MQSPEIFTDAFIIDELMDFFIAASSTTMYGSLSVCGHFATDTRSLEKVRDEFKKVVE